MMNKPGVPAGKSAFPLPRRIVIGFWIVLVASVIGRILVEKEQSQTVVPIYILGAERCLAGTPLYDPPPQGLDVYRNPPGVELIFVPFTFLPLKAADILWRLFGAALFTFGLYRFRREFLGKLSPVRFVGFWLVSTVLAIPAFNNDQINLFVIALILLGVASAAQSAWWTASIWLSLAGWLKAYPIAVAGLVAIVMPKGLIPRLIICSIVLMALPLIHLSPDRAIAQYWSFVNSTMEDDRTAAPLERAPRDWTILPRIWGDEVVPRKAAQIVSAAVGASLALLMLGLVFTEWFMIRVLFFVAAVFGITWLLLFGPATESNTFSIMAPIAGALLVMDHCIYGRVMSGFGVGLLFAGVIRSAFPTDPSTAMAFLQPIGTFVLFCSVIQWLRVNRSPFAVKNH